MPLLQIRSFLCGMTLKMWDDVPNQINRGGHTQLHQAARLPSNSEPNRGHVGATTDRLLCSGVSNRRHKSENSTTFVTLLEEDNPGWIRKQIPGI